MKTKQTTISGRAVGFEREFAKQQRKFGVAMKAAASGAGGVGTPDVFIGQDGFVAGIDCKTTQSVVVTVTIKSHKDFLIFCQHTRAIPLYIVKYYPRRGVFLYRKEDIEILEKSIKLRYAKGQKIDIKRPLKESYYYVIR